MGNKEPNLKIGTEEFLTSRLVTNNDTDVCNNDCTLIEEKCGPFTTLIASLLKLVGFSSDLLQCPFK